jgi:hypothetical protein
VCVVVRLVVHFPVGYTVTVYALYGLRSRGIDLPYPVAWLSRSHGLALMNPFYVKHVVTWAVISETDSVFVSKSVESHMKKRVNGVCLFSMMSVFCQ